MQRAQHEARLGLGHQAVPFQLAQQAVDGLAAVAVILVIVFAAIQPIPDFAPLEGSGQTGYVAYVRDAGGDVVTGDVGGIRFPGATHVLPPMPPPDIDVETWRKSIELLRGIELPLWWSSASLQPGYSVENGLVQTGTFDNVKGVMRNDLNNRDADFFAVDKDLRTRRG